MVSKSNWPHIRQKYKLLKFIDSFPKSFLYICVSLIIVVLVKKTALTKELKAWDIKFKTASVMKI